ncbi:WD40 repeat domain-containing protein [Nostoc sp. 106C]|nr:WD40 repeat domain-containing protein [Nostoc sp. 106C]
MPIDWQCIATLTEPFAVNCIAVSADKKILASAGYNSLSIWIAIA